MLATIGLAAPWRNPAYSLDVNHDTSVAPIDAVLVINYLNSDRPAQLPAEYSAPLPFYDTDGDGFVSPVDAVLVINALNAGSASPQQGAGDVGTTAVGGCSLIVTSTADSGPGSLRNAITCANTDAALDTISFNIPGTGVKTISLSSALPTIAMPVVIDGYTQPGAAQNTSASAFNGILLIEIDALGGANDTGLTLSASGSTVRGLIINGAGRAGILLLNASNTAIQGNWIGTNATATSAVLNRMGIELTATSTRTGDNVIGGASPAARNVISGNRDGIRLVGLGSTAVENTIIQGNLIGTNLAGTAALANETGVFVSFGVSGTMIGGTGAGEGNLVSGNQLQGIGLGGSQGSCTGSGILGDLSSGTVVRGNKIGTDVTGSLPLPNVTNGITVGFPLTATHVIGGTDAAAGNTIAFNGLHGVSLLGSHTAVLGNSIFANGQLGINLQHGCDVTPNDAGDADTGPNNLQNFPEISSAALSGGTLSVSYTVPSSPANSAFPLRVEFYRTHTDGQEGRQILGFDTFTAADLGAPAKTTSLTTPLALSISDHIVATATDAQGNTSEFSAVATIGSLNGAPVAQGDAYSTNEDSVLIVAASGPLANDTDAQQDSLAAVLFSGPLHGTLTLFPNGAFSYVPAANFSGPDRFEYRASDGQTTSNVATVALTILPVNDPPTAAGDLFTVPQGSLGNVLNVLANDSIAPDEGETIRIFSVGQGTAGATITIGASGSNILYTPPASFAGFDSFAYTITDRPTGGMLAQATVFVVVESPNEPPLAVGDAFVTAEDGVLTVVAPGLLSNDVDPDGDLLAAAVVTGPARGTVILNPNGSFSYTPIADFHGTDSFTYRADDGIVESNVATVAIAVAPINDAPVTGIDSYSTTANTLLSRLAPGPLGNDTDIDGDALTAVIASGPAHGFLSLGPSGAFTYSPNADYVGPDSFAYRASDGIATSNVALASINVKPATPTGPAVLTAGLIKDINTAPGGVQIHGNSLINFHGHAYFSGSLDGSDIELWRSDGTAGGTRRVRDIKEGPLGSRPSNLTAVGVLIFFTADDGAGGYELWKSDGTENGTVLVKEIHPGLRGSFPRNMLNVNTALYFSANDGVTGYELWRSDGSTEGTMLVRDIAPGERGSYPRYLTNVNGSLFFTANDGISGYELWKSDSSGTVLVKDIRPGVDSYSSVRELTNVSGTLFFRHDDGEQGAELWKSDGSEEGTQLVADIRPGFGGSNPSELTAVNESLFFSASQNGGEPVLWKSDGTEAGTFPIGGTSLPLSAPTHLTEVDGDLFFFTSAGLWKTEAAGGIPELLEPVAAPPAFSDLGHKVNINGTFYFSGGDGPHGQELWRSDGTPEGTVLLKDTLGGIQSGDPYFLTNVGGRLFFAAADGTSDAELWTSDGTHDGTQRVLIGNGSTASSVPSPAVVVGDLAFFAATDFEGGRELWRTDGTLAGTVRVADLIPGPSGSFPRYLTNVGGTLFLVADDGLGGAELWKSDGTAAGTVQVQDLRAGGGSSLPHDLINVNGVLFFAANDGVSGLELWRSDGTAAGTTLVADIQPGGNSSYPRSLTNVNGTLFFRASGGTTGLELWKSDGTAAGTALVRDIRPGSASSYLHYLTNVGGQLFFAASTAASGIELWTSDGTEAGTRLVRDIRPGAASALPRHLTNVNGRLFFRADDGAAGEELWSSDGTEVGTVLVRDIRPGPGGSAPAYLANVGGTLFFAAAGNAMNTELWKSDGTAAGTVLVAEIEPDSAGSFPALLTNAGGRLYFSAETSATGRELWTSDGTSAGTFLVADIVPEVASSLPGNIVAFGDLPLFTADDRVHGRELWTVVTVAVNRPPVAAHDSFVVVADTTLGIAAPGLLANDSDPDGNALSAVLEAGPASGTLSLAPSGAFTFVPVADFLGTDSFTYRASDGQALSAAATVSLAVTAANTPPVVTLNPASQANEGSALTASGSFVDLDGTGPWTASVNYGDGSGPQPLALAADKSFTLSHVYRDNGIFSVTVVVTDAGGASGAASLVADIRNVAPQNLTFAGPSAGSRGQAIGFTGSFTDPGLADTHTARIDWGDGTDSTPLVTGPAGGLRQIAATHAYQAGGIYRPTLIVTDDDDGSASRQREVVIEVVVVGVGLHRGVLEIIGSAENDSITVAIVQGGGLQVFGSMGGTTISQSFDAGSVERIVALMGGGSDMLTVSSTVPLPLFADGGAGSDTLLAGTGPAILLGGPGNDALRGGSRRDLLIGGVGLDQINAAGASDLLIAGRTAYDADQAALAAILAEWSAAGGYQDRVARLRGGTGSHVQPLGIKLTHNQTVFDDTVVDRLWGGSEMDWFFYDPSRDQPLDKLASEINR